MEARFVEKVSFTAKDEFKDAVKTIGPKESQAGVLLSYNIGLFSLSEKSGVEVYTPEIVVPSTTLVATILILGVFIKVLLCCKLLEVKSNLLFAVVSQVDPFCTKLIGPRSV